MWLQCHSQAGFSKHFNFEGEAYFNNILLDEDMIVVSGAYQQGMGLANILIAKLDTSGHLIAFNTFEDPGNDLVMGSANYPLIKSSDGGYIMAGNILGNGGDYIAKWDSQLNLQFYWNYPFPANISVSFPIKVIELTDGFLFISMKQVGNLTMDVFATKLDFNGNILWEYSYGDPEEDDYVSTALMINDNEIVLGAVKPGGNFPGLPQYDCARTWIFAIDSTGTKQWEWIGEDCDGSTVHSIQKTADNGWLYTTKQFEAFTTAPVVGETAGAPFLVKRDADFNKEWELRLSDQYIQSPYGYFFDLKKSGDDQYLAVGDILLPEPVNPFTSHNVQRFTCLYKVSDTGDSLWRRCDTVKLNNITWDHRPGGFVELPSGSIIVAARFIEQDVAAYGWLYKVDKNGCMHPDDCITTDVEVVHIESNAIKISPNPTSDLIYVNSDEVPDEIILLDMSGHVLSSVMHRSEMNIRDFPVGVYLLKVRLGEEVYLEKILRN